MLHSSLHYQCSIINHVLLTMISEPDISNDFLFQFGNTCYCNSVLQALYFCRPFRERVLQFKQHQKNNKKESLLTCLADLFYSIATQKKKVGTIAPKKFITRLRKEYGKCQHFRICHSTGLEVQKLTVGSLLYMSVLNLAKQPYNLNSHVLNSERL